MKKIIKKMFSPLVPIVVVAFLLSSTIFFPTNDDEFDPSGAFIRYKISTTLTISMSASCGEVGTNIHADGQLKYITGIKNAQISLMVVLPDGTMTLPTQGATTTTDRQGMFAIDFVPTTVGIHQFVASYAGLLRYSAVSAAETYTVIESSVEPEPQPVRWTWLQSPTDVMTDASNVFSIMFEIQRSGGDWICAKNTGIFFTFTDPHGVQTVLETITSSDGSGVGSVDFIPSEVGTWTVVCDWDHNNQIYAWDSSPIEEIDVIPANIPEPVKQDTIITVDSPNQVQIGSEIIMTGTLRTASGVAISGATVYVQVVDPDGSKNAIVSQTTASNGMVTYTFVPSVSGVYSILLTYNGDDMYNGTSGSKSFTANSPTPTYDYIVSDSRVKTSSGGVAYTSSSITGGLNWALGQSGMKVYVPSGTYSISSSLRLANGVTLMGDGPGTDGTIFVTSSGIRSNSVSDITIQGIRIIGGGSVEFTTTDSGAHSTNIKVENVTIAGCSNTHPAAFLCYAVGDANIIGVQYIRCVVDVSDTYGFGLFGNAMSYTGGGGTLERRAAPIWIKDVRLIECRAIDCGLTENRRNFYVCGFDLAENANIDNVYLYRCEAINNWMDGFHWENTCYVRNVIAEECVANYNGHAPTDGTGISSPGYCSHTCGFRFSLALVLGNQEGSDVTLINCMGTGNAEWDVYDYVTPGYDLPPVG